MNISSLCSRDIVSVSAKSSVREAADVMRQCHVGALVVTDPEEPGRQSRVGSLCRTNLVGVPGMATNPEAVQAMRRAGVRRLLVNADPLVCSSGRS